MKLNNPVADKIWEMIDSFRGYSFCKAHSASYTQISFECAYLRCHFPAEFMAAVISNEGGFYSISAYISECLRMGLKILPIDVNESERHYQGVANTIRIGFMAVKGLANSTIDKILTERNRNGRFVSLNDYLSRTNTSFIDNQKLNQLEAFASISPWNVSQIYWQMFEYYKIDQDLGQLELFPVFDEQPPELRAPNQEQLLDYQMELLGYLVNQHQFVLWEKQIAGMGVSYVPSSLIPAYKGRSITLLGFPITKKSAQTRRGESMAFYSFEDQFSIYDITMFPKIYERYKHFIVEKTPCFLNGLVESEFDVESITIRWVKRIGRKENEIFL